MRPPRYHDQDFMAQRWSYERGSTVFNFQDKANLFLNWLKKTVEENNFSGKRVNRYCYFIRELM